MPSGSYGASHACTLNSFVRGNVKHQPKPLYGISRNCVKHRPNTFCCASAEVAQNGQPTAGFGPATRCLQIRIYCVRSVSMSADKCRFVFGSEKCHANK